MKRSTQRKLHEYYVEQDALFIKDDSTDWMSEDKDIIRRQLGKPRNRKDKARNIIETELLNKDDFFYLLVGAPFGGGTSTLAKWLAYSYASEYAKAYSDNQVHRNDDTPAVRHENELHCIPIVLSLKKGRKGSVLDEAEIYHQKRVNDLLGDIIAPSLELNPAKILLILDGIDQLDYDGIIDLQRKIWEYRDHYPRLKVLLLSKLMILPSDLIGRRFARLLPFDDPQAEEYFRKAGGIQKEHYGKLKTSYQELVNKPLFAWMICLLYRRDQVANHPVIKREWSKLKQNALVYMHFFAHIGKSKFPDNTGDRENYTRRNWFRALRAIAAFKHISKNDVITFDGIAEKLKEVKIEVNNSPNITSKDALEPIIVETQVEDVNFAHESFRDYLVATFYIESLLSYSSSNSGPGNAKENYLKQYNVNIGFEIPDRSKIIDFLEGLLEILLDKEDIESYVTEGVIDLRDSFGHNIKNRENIYDKITANTKAILANHYLLISDIRDALGENPWLKKWYDNEKKTSESAKSFKIGNLWIHLWISLFILNKLTPGFKVHEINDLDQILVLSSNRIPPDLKRMKEIDLSDTQLSGIDLYRADLSYAIIEKAKLCGANLCEARLIEAKLMYSDLSNAKLCNAFMLGADLSGATLLRADLSGIKLIPMDEKSREEEYKKANFSNTNLCDANISDAKMQGVDLTDADLYRANLCDSDLSKSTLKQTKLTFANLSYAILHDATIDGPNLSYANLSEADLVGVNFSSCFSDNKKDNFTNVNLSNAKIHEAKPIDRLLKYQSSPPLDEKLVKIFPADKEEEVPLSTYIIDCFSKPIKKLSNDRIYCLSLSKSIVFDDDSQQQIKGVKPPYIEGKISESEDGETIVFKPSCPLEYSSRYGVIIEDSAGQELAKWWFTTASSGKTTSPSSMATVIAEKEIANVKVIGGISHDGNLYDRTLDSEFTTRWSNYSKGSWIKYDLGSEQDICAIDIGWFKGDKRIYDFEIKYSISDNDDNDYERVDLSSSRSSGKTLSPERYTFDKVRARYIKIIVNGNSQNNWASITEVAFYERADSSSS